MARAAFTGHERLLAQLSPAGLGIALDRRAHREAQEAGMGTPVAQHLRPPHLELLDLAIIDLVAGRLDSTTLPGTRPLGLIVETPPRHGKSETISRRAPAWFLGTHPHKRVALTSYETRLARSWGRKARDMLKETGGDLYGVAVSDASKSAEEWDLDGTPGGMVTAGVGGPLTGRGADLLIVDDYVKNAEEAASEVIRAKTWDWWQSTARTRIHPGGVAIVVATRWHDDDLIGRLLKQAHADPEADQWHRIRLPALAEADDPLGRQPGEALWADRYDVAELDRIRASVGAYYWSALFQQSPTPDEGGLFKRDTFRHWEPGGDGTVVLVDGDRRTVVGLDHCRRFWVWDLAVSEKQTADYTVGLYVALTPEGDSVYLDMVRVRAAGPDQPDLIAEAHERRRGEFIAVEQMGYQLALIQQLVRRGLPVRAVHPDKDKVSRASAAAVRFQLGKVWFPRGWGGFEQELLAFPLGEHDDQVDVVAYAERLAQDLAPQRRGIRTGGGTVTGGLSGDRF